MKYMLLSGIFMVPMLWGSVASAGPSADKLNQCVTASTTIADKRILARWMFSIIGNTDALKDMVSLTVQQKDELSRESSVIFTRVMTKDCRKEILDVSRNEGQDGTGAAFRLLGNLAVKDLISQKIMIDVAAAMIKYVDQREFLALSLEQQEAITAYKQGGPGKP